MLHGEGPDKRPRPIAVVETTPGSNIWLLRTDAQFTGTLEVNLDPENDGVYIGVGSDVVGLTDVGGEKGLNIHIIDTPVGFDGTNYKFSLQEDATLPGEGFNGADTIAAAETQLNGGTPQAIKRGATLQADDDNDETVYIGVSGVLAGNGIRLEPGTSVPVDIDDISKIYAICATGGQLLRWFGS